ncbi:MAG: plasmid pRiA4b ORF-3 family protein [Leptolyngbyaceae cyanobacterium]
MAKSTKSMTVPKAMREKFERITAITDEFAQQHLNDEYAKLIRQATAALCRKRPSPLTSGKDHSWACGISHAIGMANFLFDTSQDPHISATDLYAWFGVGNSTGQGKSKKVRDLLDIGQLDPDWCLPSKLADNPMAWLVSVNGMILDARSAPQPVQEQLVAAGLIPYVPNQNQTKTATVELPPPTVTPIERPPDALYVLSVMLIEGPVTEAFAEAHPQVIRTIEIKGSQTLAALHQILFQAFDREDEHLYEFQVGGRGPQDPNARRYGLDTAMDTDLTGEVAKTNLNDLNLVEAEIFGYWFDFGDDWWHMIEVKAIRAKAGKGKYPKITDRVGPSPPQYADFD